MRQLLILRLSYALKLEQFWYIPVDIVAREVVVGGT